MKRCKRRIGGSNFPNIYILDGDFTNEEMNSIYNHPQVKAHVSFTHGEGFGRPLLEACISGKPLSHQDGVVIWTSYIKNTTS